MIFDTHPRLPRGFSCGSTNCGLKPVEPDLALFFSDVPAAAAAMFTRNLFPGAPIIVGRDIIKGGRLQAVVVNSKVSNVGTGAAGIANARRMASAVADAFGTAEDQVLMSSTGVIGKPLPIENIEAGIRALPGRLGPDPMVGARGIMTTDTHPKAISIAVDQAVLTLVGKGAGMIEPNMATMLVYVFTDAALAAPDLDTMLRRAVDVSFNMLSVDTDTSTSDTVAILANGMAGAVDPERFETALTAGCLEMTRMLARDGEGATKLLTATVRGASTREQARFIAKSLVNSPLIKTMAYGADPNIGRILMAVGKCVDCAVTPEKLVIYINDRKVFEAMERVDFDETRMRALLAGDPVAIAVDLCLGPGEATAFGCDLTEGYIQENAAYYSS